MRIRIRVFTEPASRPGVAHTYVVTAGGAAGLLPEPDAVQVFEMERGPAVIRPWSLALPLEEADGRRRVVLVDVDATDTIEEGD